MDDELVNKKYDEVIKIVLLGEVFTGKSSLINAYMNENFNPDLRSTVSPSYYSKTISIKNKTILINMWDTAGQEQYRAMNKIFIKNSNIILFIYDITNKKTLNNLSFWYTYVQDILGNNNVLYAVVGNKIDLFDKEQELKAANKEFNLVNTEEGIQYAHKIGAEFLETSAKEFASGFVDFIAKLVGIYSEKYLNNKKKEEKKLSIDLGSDAGKLKEKKKCC